MLQARRVSNSEPVGIRAMITDFRGDEFIYISPTRANEEFKDGKIIAQRPHSGQQQEYYASVFGLKVLDI